MKKLVRYIGLLLMPMSPLMWAGCTDDAVDDSVNANLGSRVSLAFNISTNRNDTRMSDAVTQQEGQSYRGIQDLKIFPFDIAGTIYADATPLSGMTYEMNQNEVVETNYFDDRSVKIPDGTASFLCYARAVPQTEREMVPLGEVESKFVNGTITATGLTGSTPNTSNISFAPEVIHNSVEIEEGDEPSKIAAYLTAIANAIPDDKRDFFFKFVNKGYPVACSGTNVARLAAWAKTEAGVDLSSSYTYDANYPADINLPDGAAVVMWQKPQGENAFRFVPQLVTTTEANINRLDRFIYPAELWYYANSRIKTSPISQKEYYNQSWETVLAKYDEGYGVMDASVHSVAINDPLTYAVGCLQVGLVVSDELTDADEENPTTFDLSSLSSGTFPLRAVIVSGQHAQAFDFTSKDDITEYIIYDNEITGITMGDAKTSTLTTTKPDKYTNTLVFQSKDGADVRFALEFENNSGTDFLGVDGMVFKGTKFYLVGNINVPVEQTDDWKKRAFTKNYTTRGTVTISSLKQAYTYLPDLLDPRLEIGVKLVPDWIQSTTINVPL